MTTAAAHQDTCRIVGDPLWAPVQTAAPTLAATCRFYVDQIGVSARPATTTAADRNLRYFADWLIVNDPTVRCFRT
jgi:hypothetical protein